MDSPLTIREATRDDLDDLVNFNLAMAEETEGRALSHEKVSAGVAGVFEMPARGFYLVAERADHIVGSLMVTREWSDWRNGDFWWIQSVYVRPVFRQQGIFRALYTEVRERATDSPDVCGCRLYVEKDNRSAQAVYHRLGFHETDYRLYEESFNPVTPKPAPSDPVG